MIYLSNKEAVDSVLSQLPSCDLVHALVESEWRMGTESYARESLWLWDYDRDQWVDVLVSRPSPFSIHVLLVLKTLGRADVESVWCDVSQSSAIADRVEKV